ncbi:MAG: glycerol-3-phosphate 1-O-acyltransferase PlsY [Chloroflexi bacterium]|nr:glycerol-3-phosphate 1-O-acyltransferase PlsY [Chloroflexota bacterium]
MTKEITYAALVIISYLLGSIPSGVIAGRLAGVDIRKHGSGNIGTTNVLRTLGRKASAAVFVADFGKGLLPVVAAQLITSEPLVVAACGVAAVVGHSWSAYLGFTGGRGVATGFGALLLISPLTFVVVLMASAVVISTWRYVSLGSITGAALTPVVMAILVITGLQPAASLLFGVGIAAMVIYRHRPNIERLLAGTEHKLGDKVGAAGS